MPQGGFPFRERGFSKLIFQGRLGWARTSWNVKRVRLLLVTSSLYPSQPSELLLMGPQGLLGNPQPCVMLADLCSQLDSPPQGLLQAMLSSTALSITLAHQYGQVQGSPLSQ
jgi:hypothetical protein